MVKENTLRGRVWVVKTRDGKSIDSIDTDQIFHNRFLTITDIDEMGTYAFSNLEGWTDFPEKAKSGDLLIVGKNFGAGSSRQQAVDCFIALGIQAIVGESFGSIYKRNAINAGFPLLEVSDIIQHIETGEEIAIDLLEGTVLKSATGETFRGTPFSPIQWQIYEAGGLFSVDFS